MRLQTETLDLRIDGALDAAIGVNIDRLVREKFASRLFEHDLTLWHQEDQAEAATRLGWLDAPEPAIAAIERGEQLRTRFDAQGVSRYVLCGMGGSSLGPEMLAKYSGVELHILDSTDPVAVRAAMRELDRTAIIVSSKSGTTVETRSHLSAFERAFEEAGIAPNSRIVIITDPESNLAQHATSQGYELVLADPNVGGRFSVFTAYGLVPVTIAGANLRPLIRDAQEVRSLLAADSSANPALALAAASLQLADGLMLAPEMNAVGLADWVEQLVAESTGKAGVGVLPVVLPEAGAGLVSPTSLEFSGNLGQLIFTWEVATAAMGWLLEVNPFDQPDVERSKTAARELLNDSSASVMPETGSSQALTPDEIVDSLRQHIAGHGYLAILIFGSAESSLAQELQQMASAELRVPVTLGWGPRFLHSTGQLHKGGPARGVFLQVMVARDAVQDVSIPNQEFTFAQLLSAQAMGDAAILRQTGQHVLQTTLSLEELLGAFSPRT